MTSNPYSAINGRRINTSSNGRRRKTPIANRIAPILINHSNPVYPTMKIINPINAISPLILNGTLWDIKANNPTASITNPIAVIVPSVIVEIANTITNIIRIKTAAIALAICPNILFYHPLR